MLVRSSNLALRFYEKDGWTKEHIEFFLVEGEVLEQKSMFCSDYYIVSVGSTVDFRKLRSLVSRVDRAFDDNPNESDNDFMKKHLWNTIND